MNATLLAILNLRYQGWHYQLLDVYDTELKDIVYDLAKQLGLIQWDAYKQAFVFIVMKQAAHCRNEHLTVT